jgi:hypothetical protein
MHGGGVMQLRNAELIKKQRTFDTEEADNGYDFHG